MSHNIFDYIIIFLIVVSSITFAIDSPLLNPEETLAKIIKTIDICLTGIFVLEVILKSIAFGVLLNGKKSYLRNTWNIIDIIIIFTSVLFFL